MRIDLYLVTKGFCESRNKAARLIYEGKVLLDGIVVEKASADVSDCSHEIEITQKEKYVGRGGLKLESAIMSFSIDVKDKKCIDVGASTGGFTDCLLMHGAKNICAIDSGRGQLHQKFVSDGRVKSIEGFNAKALSPEKFGYFDVAVTDVSFISQTLLHAPISSVLNDGAEFVSLIKPQFEAGRSAISKRGIVKRPEDRENAVLRVVESAQANGLGLLGLIRSPIEGGDGNIEYLAYFVKNRPSVFDSSYLKKYLQQLCKD